MSDLSYLLTPLYSQFLRLLMSRHQALLWTPRAIGYQAQ